MKRMILNNPGTVRYFPAFLGVKPYTLVRFPSLVQMAELVRDLDARGVEGAVVEAGCWRGGLVSFTARYTKRNVLGIDTFEGLGEPGRFDARVSRKYGKAKGHLAVAEPLAPLPAHARYAKGDAAKLLPETIALLRIDVDLYDDTKRILQAAKDKLVQDAWVVLDDYDDFEGARRAVHEFLCEERKFPKIRQYPYGGSFFFLWG